MIILFTAIIAYVIDGLGTSYDRRDLLGGFWKVKEQLCDCETKLVTDSIDTNTRPE